MYGIVIRCVLFRLSISIYMVCNRFRLPFDFEGAFLGLGVCLSCRFCVIDYYFTGNGYVYQHNCDSIGDRVSAVVWYAGIQDL